jgi:uncharacterized protein YjdB
MNSKEYVMKRLWVLAAALSLSACQKTISGAYQGVTGLALSPTLLTVPFQGTARISAAVYPEGAADTLVWQSRSTDVARVTAEGLGAEVFGMSAGNTMITAATRDGSVRAEVPVQVLAASAMTRVTGVALNASEVKLRPGGTRALSASISPANASNQNLSWYTSDSAVAAVSAEGAAATVTALVKGAAWVTCMTEDGLKTASARVTVSDPVSAVSISESQGLTLYTDETGALHATVTPSDAGYDSVTWNTDAAAIATVSQAADDPLSATVNPVGTGTAHVTVTVDGKTNTVAVTVQALSSDMVAGVSLDKTSVTLAGTGSTETLSAVLSPNTATSAVYTWVSDNEDVVTVAGSGAAATLTAVAQGSTKVRVTVDRGKSAEVTVTVGDAVVSGRQLKVLNMKAASLNAETTADTEDLLAAQSLPLWTETTWSSGNGDPLVVSNKESTAQIGNPNKDATLVYLSTPLSGPYTWRVTISIALVGELKAANDDGLFFGVFLNPEAEASAIKLVGVRHGSSGVVRRLFWSGGTNVVRYENPATTPTMPGGSNGTLAINTSYVYEISWDGSNTFTNKLTDSGTTYVWTITGGTGNSTVHTDLTSGPHYPGFMVSAAAVTVEEMTITGGAQ